MGRVKRCTSGCNPPVSQTKQSTINLHIGCLSVIGTGERASGKAEYQWINVCLNRPTSYGVSAFSVSLGLHAK